MRRRVLFLLAHLHKGGMQRAVSNISLALPEWVEQHIGFFGTEDPGFRYRGCLHDFQLDGGRSTRLGRKAITFVRRVNALRRFVSDYRIDTVVSFGEAANVYSLASKHGARTIISVRVDLDSSLAQGKYSWLFGKAIEHLYPRADLAVSVSRDLAARILVRVPSLQKKLVVINNLYHIDAIRQSSGEALPPELARLEEGPFVLSVGSLQHQKGHDLLLEAFARARLPTTCRLVVLGRGGWRERLLAQARSLGVLDRFVLVDFDTNPYRYMRRAAAFVLSSRFEGFPNVLVEAMASGAPVVAFDCPTGPREILGCSEHGRLVPPADTGKLASAIEEVVGSRDVREHMRAAAIGRARLFGADMVVPRWTEVL